jgi:hypothetical protein
MFAEYLGRDAVIEGLGVTEAPRDFADDPPVRPRLARRFQERALAREAALGIGHRAVLFTPGAGRQQHMRIGRGIGGAHAVGNDDELALRQRLAHAVGVRQAHGGIGGHDPQRLDFAFAHGAEQVHGLQAGFLRDIRAVPEAPHAVHVAGVEIHVRRQLVREPADLAPAHGVGLARDRERPHARSADAPREQVAVDDGVDLVGAAGGLIDALRIDADGFFVDGKPQVKPLDVLFPEAATGGDGGRGGRAGMGGIQRWLHAFGMNPRNAC